MMKGGGAVSESTYNRAGLQEHLKRSGLSDEQIARIMVELENFTQGSSVLIEQSKLQEIIKKVLGD